jgi:hypothetical protein
MDYDAIRERERSAKLKKTYSSPGMEKLREAEKGPNETPVSRLTARQQKERQRMGDEQHSAGQALSRKHETELAKCHSSSMPIPVALQKRQAQERAAMTDKKQGKRNEMARRHLVERDALRQGR